MSNDIECQVCHRISLAYENHKTCQQCHWPIRAEQLDAPIFGYDVAIQISRTACDSEVITKHYRTPDEKTARRRAKTVHNFRQVLAVRPLTEKQWIGGYGNPFDKSKFS
jgi:hypothetical protein